MRVASSAISAREGVDDAAGEDHHDAVADQRHLLELGGVEEHRLALRRRARAAGGRSPAWCARRCRGSGRSRGCVRASAAIQRAIVTFCWLPPERRCTSRWARVSICSRSMAAPTRAPSRRRSIGPQAARRALKGSAMFSRTERCISRPSARSPGTSAMPARDGVGGVGEVRPGGRRPRWCRRRGGSEPERAAKSSSWPWPSRATMPTTSPSRSSKETSSSLVPTREAPRREAGRAVVRRGGGGGGRRRGRARCGRRASARRCAPRRRGRWQRRRRSRRRAARWRGRRARRSRGSGAR